MSVNVVIKWNKSVFQLEVDPSNGTQIFKSQVYSLTGVPVDRQKLMAKGAWSGVLKDDADMILMPICEGQQIMLMGTADAIAEPITKVAFIEDMSIDEKAIAGAIVLPAGLNNLGNTCYMNATLQCFRKMPELRTALNGLNGSDPSTQFTVALRETLNVLDRSGEAVTPMQFVNLLRGNFPQFAQRSQSSGGFMQQDAEEFYNILAQSLTTSLSSKGERFNSYLGLEMEETLICQETDAEAAVVKGETVNKLVHLMDCIPIFID
jgi:ubiquitin carboxyl-terminal hydrolase 14